MPLLSRKADVSRAAHARARCAGPRGDPLAAAPFAPLLYDRARGCDESLLK